MNITRDNYEEFFMLYADDELSAADRKQVEAFIAANPDLQQELALFQDFKLSPDSALVFANKEVLMKQEEDAGAINMTNYESFFVLYADNELSNEEKAAVEAFVYSRPQLQASFELLQAARMTPDNSIVFDNKESLYRKEEDDKVIPFAWWKPAVAAMVLLVAGLFWLAQTKKINHATDLTKNNSVPAVTNPAPSPLHKEEVNSNDTTDSSVQAPVQKENIAVSTPVKENQVKSAGLQDKEKTVANHTKPVNGAREEANYKEAVAVNNDVPELNTSSRLTASNLTAIKTEPGKKADINTAIAAAADKSVINQQLVYHSTEANDKAAEGQVAVANTADKLEVLNTSVDTKNSLRGFFRKATRMIAKKTNSGDDDSKHKSILIGGFEIAVR